MNEFELDIRRRHELWMFHGAANSPGGQCHRDREWLLAELDRLRTAQELLAEKWRYLSVRSPASGAVAMRQCADELDALVTCAAGEILSDALLEQNPK